MGNTTPLKTNVLPQMDNEEGHGAVPMIVRALEIYTVGLIKLEILSVTDIKFSVSNGAV